MLDHTQQREMALETMRSWDGVEKRMKPAPLYVKARLLSYFTMLVVGSMMFSGFYLGFKLIWKMWV